MCEYHMHVFDSSEGQKRVSDLLDLELQVALSYLMWVLETEPESST